MFTARYDLSAVLFDGLPCKVSTHSEGLATGHLDTSFPWLFYVSKQIANAEMVPKIPSCYCMLLIQPCRFKLSKLIPLLHGTKMKINFLLYDR